MRTLVSPGVLLLSKVRKRKRNQPRRFCELGTMLGYQILMDLMPKALCSNFKRALSDSSEKSKNS